MTASRRRAMSPLALSCVLLLMALAWAPARAAHAQSDTSSQPPAQVRVILDTLAPAVPRPGGTLRIAGRVHNAGTEGVGDLSVRLRMSEVRIGSRSELQALAEGSAARSDRGLDESLVLLDDLAAGSTAPFEVTVALDDLGLGEFGVYPIAVEVRGSATPGFGRLGITRTFLPWAPEPIRVEPTRLAWLWPLADRPRRHIDGAFADDTLATDLAAGGRLATLVDAAAGRPVTWVVDPMLLEDAADMSDGYAVAVTPADGPAGNPAEVPAAGEAATGDGERTLSTEAGSGDEAARTFLERLRTGSAQAEVVPLLYGDLDSVAAQRHGLAHLVPEALARGAATAQEILGRQVRSGVTMPPGGWVDGVTAGLLAREGQDTLVLADAALRATGLPYTPTGRATVALEGVEPLDTLLVDERLARVVAADTSRPGGRVLARQHFLAETAMVTAERPGDRRTIALAPPTRWDPGADHAAQLLALTARAPWIEPIGLAEALAASPPDVGRQPLAYPREASAAELPARYLDRLRGLDTTLATITDVLSEPGGIAASHRVQQLRLSSAGLREAESLRHQLLTGTRRSLAERVDGVRVLPTSVQLPSREGSFPVTVANDLDQAVTVRLLLSTDSPRLSVGGSETVTIAAGGKQQVLVPAEAVANGVVTVDARLATPGGTPFGEPEQIRVRVAQYGLAALLVTGGAALLLFAAAARNVVRRLHGRCDVHGGAGGDGFRNADGDAGGGGVDNAAAAAASGAAAGAPASRTTAPVARSGPRGRHVG